MNFKGLFLTLLTITLCSCKDNSRSKQTPVAAERGTDTIAYLEKGKQIAMKTQGVLGATLKQKIAEGGPANAIEFCNLRALPITDSLSKANNARIRRVTNKARNGTNRANSEALVQMDKYRQLLSEGKELKGVVIAKEDHVQTYYPIVTVPLCIQCHGQPETDIKATTMSSILERYPADRATGYKPGELRGLWSIQFEKQN